MVIVNEESSVTFGLYRHYKGDTYLVYNAEIDANFDDGRLRVVYKKVEADLKGNEPRVLKIIDQQFSRSVEYFYKTLEDGQPRFELISKCFQPEQAIEPERIVFIGKPEQKVVQEKEYKEVKVLYKCPSCGSEDFYQRDTFLKCLDCQYTLN